MDIMVQLFSADFRWLWIEVGKNAGLSFILALPLAITSKKMWPIVAAMLIAVFAIDLHGYSKIISSLGFDIKPLNGRTIVNSYGFELALIGGIYFLYIVTVLKKRNILEWQRIQEKFSLLILTIAIGFQANIFIDTFIQNSGLFYEPLTTILRYFVEVNIVDIPKVLLGMYMTIFIIGIYLFSWEYRRQKCYLLWI